LGDRSLDLGHRVVCRLCACRKAFEVPAVTLSRDSTRDDPKTDAQQGLFTERIIRNAGLMKAYDVVIIGGGHNGLVAAAYLAKAGQRVLVLERRSVLGGAAVSEHPFGPDYTVTSLSYVVSWLSPAMVRD